ncbi:RHS repeat-associated core domain-containing protein [Agriterribacter sp.]|uniref:RHS repeat-associated core domain-containing protein n=1 Tax=Agriterribacter sp. TaxID=2821509 RepID=UPI002BB0A697|nr:RHS repeat-associated core domain-containing protein [Agriterribacter sp.]HRP55601.1 RHS repeat-associated core domain-containing protein [Agriterribacter sp.]
MPKHLFILILGTFFLSAAGAADETPLIAPLEGRLGQLKPGAIAQVQDMDFYADLQRNPKKFEETHTRSIVCFSIDEASRLFLKLPFRATLVYRLYFSFKSSPYTEDSLDEDQTMIIDYDTAQGRSFNAKNSFVFENAVKVTVKIVDIKTNAGGWDPIPSLKLTNELQINRIYSFDCEENKVQQINFIQPTDSDADELKVFWQPAEGADEYDLEWTYIDQPAYSSGIYGTPGSEGFGKTVFKNNGTRVTLNSTMHHYNIHLLFDKHGWLVFRVRPVQVKASGQRTEANWSGYNSFEFILGHQPNLNWQASISFAEEGKRKTVLQYFDGSLRKRQTVTKDNTENTTIVAETFYDYQGRPAIQVLPSPTVNTLIKYTPHFNNFLNDREYYKDNYDRVLPNSDYCSGAAQALDPAKGGAAQYYSPQNPEKEQDNNKLIPDAKGFPFAETKYTQDNTGRIAAQGGVGAYHQLATGHETKYYYGNPDQAELDALFGTEAGKASHYFKNMVRDANGQYSVSYMDMHGRTVATALAGDLPADIKLDDLPSKQDSYLTKTLTDASHNMIKGLTIESSKGLLVAKAGSHRFSYSLLPEDVNIRDCKDANICYTCSYTIEITISDDCGNKQFGGTPFLYTDVIGGIGTNCAGVPEMFAKNFDKTLQEGSYTITKKLTIRDEALKAYREMFAGSNLCKTVQDFVEEQKRIFLNSTNNCASPCYNCEQQLGSSQQAFVDKFITDNGLNKDLAFHRQLAVTAYTKLFAQCEELCGTARQNNYLDNLRMLMLQDVTPPYGQYADVEDYMGTGNTKEYYKNGIFGPISSGNSNYRYTIASLNYKNEDGSTATVTLLRNGNWQTLKPQQLTIEEFVSYFQPSWAEALADNLHPERMQYNILNTTAVFNNQPAVGSASYDWDMDFMATETFEQAQQKGFLNPTNNSAFARRYATTFNGSNSNADPFFALHSNLRNEMHSFMQRVAVGDGYTADIWNAASIAGFCTEQNDLDCLQKQISDPFGVQGCAADLDMAWRAFRAMYKSKKDELILNMIKSITGTAPVIDETKYHSYFTSNTDAIQNGTGITNINSKNNIEPALQDFYTDQSSCAGYAELWWQKLSPCDIQKLLPYKAQLLSDLVTVCAKGTDETHVMGASSIAPGASNTFSSFDEVLAYYVQLYNAANPATPIGILDCNGSLLNFPAPYSQQQVLADKPVITRPEPCECEKITQLHNAYTEENRDTDFSAYIERRLHTIISNGALDTLLDLCSGSIDCKFISPPLHLPPALQCGADNVCVPCIAVKEGFDAFAGSYPDIIPRIEETTEEQQKMNALFAHYMNKRFGFSKGAQDYLAFMTNCITRKANNACDSLQAVMNKFNRDVNPLRVMAALQSNSLRPTVYERDITQSVSDGMLRWPEAIRDTAIGYFEYFQHVLAGSSYCSGNGYAVEFKFRFLKDDISANQEFFYYTDANGGFVLYRRKSGPVINQGTFLGRIRGIDPASGQAITVNNEASLISTDPDLIFKEWTAIRFELSEEYFRVYANNTLLRETARTSAPLKNIRAFTLSFMHFQAVLDWTKIYNPTGKLVFFDDYLTNATRQTVAPSFVCPEPAISCEQSFTTYFNQQKGTHYTYEQIDSVYFKTCGKHVNVCNDSYLRKDSLMPLADAFIKNYASINNNGIDTGLPPVYWSSGGLSSNTGLPVRSGNLSEIVDTGALHMPSGSGPLYYSSINYNSIKDICVQNEYAVEVRIKNPVAASRGGDVVISTYTHSINTDSSDIDEDFAVDFVPNRANASFYRLRGVRHYDTSFSYKNFMDWRIIKLAAKQETFRVYYEGSLIFKIPRDGRSYIDIIKPYLQFQQGADVQLDWMKLYGTNDELIFFEDFNDTANLASHTKEYTCPSADCITKFERYFNRAYGVSCNFSQIDSLYNANSVELKVCNDSIAPSSFDPDLLLCGKNTVSQIAVETGNETPCADSLDFAISRGYERYRAYSDSVRGEFTKAYLNKCLQAAQHERFTVQQPVSEYHYTLYYYDQAGNLVKTIPPEGVHPNYDAAWLESVKNARNGNMIIVPDHRLVTQYRYNTLNQVVHQKTPDAGESRFWYDRPGRLTISQNARQAIPLSTGGGRPEMRYSYTLYDYLGRLTETGQINNTAEAMNNNISRNPVRLQSWMKNNASGKKQVTATFYDLPAKESYLHKDLSPYIMYQSNLRNRVAFTLFAANGDISNYDYAAFYNYDIAGNTDTLLQDYGPSGVLAQQGNRYKLICYRYDLISGKVNSVSYQPRLYNPVTKQYITQPDGFYHQYSYDAENRLTGVYTSADNVHWEHDAHYQYYKHGPLSRAIIGENQVQGIDYAYTLQGWLKGVNGTAMEGGVVARDAYHFSLHYYGNDYTAINAPNAYKGLSSRLQLLDAYKPLYNSNISSMGLDIVKLGIPLLYNYRYDQLNRITGMDVYKGNSPGNNIWNNGLATMQDYKESISYDANGNILTYRRNGFGSTVAMDELTYHYQPGNNRLDHITDRASSANYASDIDDQQAGNYDYDETGNLIRDRAEGIDKVEWTVYGKIKSIAKVNGETIEYAYDAAGNRISKSVAVPGAAATTLYVRDAGGNVMAVYGINSSDNKLFLNEQHIYGTNRLGMYNPGKDLSIKPSSPLNMGYGNSGDLIIFERGKKRFELSNHLGNVLVIVSDKKKAHDAGNGTIDYYESDVVSAQDYYPFGMQMPARTFRGGPGSYRYGFNGKEQDKEGPIQYDYGFRIYDPRLARFKSVDPLTPKYPELTPYQFASNRPVDGVDLDGLEYVKRIHILNVNKQVLSTKDVVYYQMDKKTLLAHGGTPPDWYNSAGYGPEGKGVKHEYYYENGKQAREPLWNLPQNSFINSLGAHGIYSGDGSITKTGTKDYDFSWQPIDASDAIAKRHDMNYANVSAFDVVEDSRTLFADRQMVEETQRYLNSIPFRILIGQNVASETIVSAISQNKFIGILADYKEWKTKYMKENNLSFDKIEDNIKISLNSWRVRLAYINSDKDRRKERLLNLGVLLTTKEQTSDAKKNK